MNFIDMHIHLQDYKSNCATDIINMAVESGLKKLVCASVIEDDWAKIADLAEKHPSLIVPAFGLHPWYLHKTKTDWQQRIIDFLQYFPKSMIGETGIDKLKGNEALQLEMFATHIELAKEYNRPLIIHSVKAEELIKNFWSQMPARFMFHSFNSTPSLLSKIIANGGYISFGLSILKSKYCEEIVLSVPMDRILLESDGPYQSLERGLESSPLDILPLAEKIASLRVQRVEDFLQNVYANSEEFINGK